MSRRTERFIIEKADGDEIEPKSDDVGIEAAGRPFPQRTDPSVSG